MRRIRVDVLVALLILGAHTYLVWGNTGIFWGDIGRWSHEVERFARGELPYRDFQWHYPPFGLWLEGGAARVLGTDRTPLTVITTSLALLLVVASVQFTRQVLDRTDAAVVAVSLVLAFAYAQTVGAPVPLGVYSPAALVGTLCMANAARLFLKSLSADEGRDADWMALFAALAVLSKQDFWLPAAYMVGTTFLRSRRPGAVAISASVFLVGVAIIVWTAGVGILLSLAGGFGHARLAGGQGFPSWERLTIDLFTLSLVGAVVSAMASVARRRLLILPLAVFGGMAAVTGGLHIAFSMRTLLPEADALTTPTQNALSYHLQAGGSLVRPAIGWLRERASRTPIPVFLAPLLLLATALRWKKLPQPRRAAVALLLGLAIAIRARRAFEGTEWFEFLLTLPIMLASFELLLGLEEVPLRRFRTMSVGVLALLAVWAYSALGRGPGTVRWYPAAETIRGVVHWKPSEVRDYRLLLAAVDSIDPSRTRPLFGFGFSGGFNYWLKRRNPFPVTQDFYFSAFDADAVLATRPPGLLLIDQHVLEDGSFGAATFDWRSWEQPRVAAPYRWYDRPRFDRLRTGCAPIPLGRTIFQLYACP